MKKVYVVMEENCDTTEPFIDDGYAKIILTTLDNKLKVSALAMITIKKLIQQIQNTTNEHNEFSVKCLKKV